MMKHCPISFDAFAWIWAGKTLYTLAFILLLSSPVTSSMNTSEPVPVAAIHTYMPKPKYDLHHVWQMWEVPLSPQSGTGWSSSHLYITILGQSVVKLLALDPQGRWFNPCYGHDKICTAFGPLSKALNRPLLQGVFLLLSLINCTESCFG